MKQLFTLIIFLALSNVYGQKIIWGGSGDPNSEFDMGLNDWTTKGYATVNGNLVENNSAVWVWEADGLADRGAFYNSRYSRINSPSISNGAMVFDSDFYDNAGIKNNYGNGIAPATQVGELISPIISTKGYDKLGITWTQSAFNFESSFELHVSNDGGKTFDVIQLEDNNIKDHLIIDEKKYVDISEFGADTEALQFKFVFKANYFYWIIDDVSIVTPPENSLEVLTGKRPISTFSTPKSMINNDTLEFSCSFTNKGTKPTTCIAKMAISNTDLEIFYSAQELIDSVYPGDTVSYNFDYKVLPENINLDTGSYIFVYSVEDYDQSVSDFYEYDNYTEDFYFEVTENLLSPSSDKTNATTIGSNFYSTTVFKTGDLTNIQDRYWLKELTTSAAVKSGIIPSSNVEVLVYKSKINTEDVNIILEDPNIGNFDVNNENLELVGTGFESVKNYTNYENVTIEIISNDSDQEEEGLFLDQSSTYVIAVKWDESESNEIIGHAVSTDVILDKPICFANLNGWFFVKDNVSWHHEMKVDVYENIETSTDKNKVEVSVSISPNPVSDIAIVNLNIKTSPKTVNLRLRNINGSYISTKKINNAKTDHKVELDVSELPVGIYTIEVFTEKGLLCTKKLSVIR